MRVRACASVCAHVHRPSAPRAVSHTAVGVGEEGREQCKQMDRRTDSKERQGRSPGSVKISLFGDTSLWDGRPSQMRGVEN